jgi:hypothetical protein
MAIAFVVSGCDNSGAAPSTGQAPATGQTSTPPPFGGDPVPTPTSVRTSGSELPAELVPGQEVAPPTDELFPDPPVPQETSSTETPNPPEPEEGGGSDGDGDAGEAGEAGE